jgi:hypothetical protein
VKEGKMKLYLVVETGGEWDDFYYVPIMAFAAEERANLFADQKNEERNGEIREERIKKLQKEQSERLLAHARAGNWRDAKAVVVSYDEKITKAKNEKANGPFTVTPIPLEEDLVWSRS